MVDKILVTNAAALKAKYTNRGLRTIQAAVRELVAADKARGLATRFVDISDHATMRRYKAPAVSNPKSARQSKDAIDAIYRAMKPDYIVLVDGPDVIPHFALNNPVPKDKDVEVPSDLPYASDSPYSTRDAARYAAVTRVVGRIPGISGASEPSHLVKLIRTAANFRSRRRADYLRYFAMSASVWSKSTELSVDNIFGNKAVRICPPSGTPGVRRMMSPLSQFINCHGGEVDPQFYGQSGQRYPVSMTSDDVAKGAPRNAIVAAECCFGAQLFNPSLAMGKWPISNAYLAAGAAGFFGSSTTAYGPADGNSGADLITQYFLINVLAGASIGRACLQARQKFVSGQKMEDPVNMKTLAQFLLLGDPALQPCLIETPDARAASKVIDYAAARRTRRVALSAAGKAAADSSGFPGKKIVRPPKVLHNLVRSVARRRGFRARTDDIDSFHIVGGAQYGNEMKARGVEQKVVVVTDHRKDGAGRRNGAPLIRILVAHAQDNRLIHVAEYVRR